MRPRSIFCDSQKLSFKEYELNITRYLVLAMEAADFNLYQNKGFLYSLYKHSTFCDASFLMTFENYFR